MKPLTIALFVGLAGAVATLPAAASSQASVGAAKAPQNEMAKMQLAQATLGSTGEYNGRSEERGDFKKKKSAKKRAMKKSAKRR